MFKWSLILLCSAYFFSGCASSLSKPGVYGNWHVKIPREDEKSYFNSAFLGPASPKDRVKKSVFVGWHGTLISCKQNTENNFFTLLLDHRHASHKNIRFGPNNLDSLYGVSVFGDGLFLARQKGSCPNDWMSGDLVRIYGKVLRKSLNKENDKYLWKVTILHARHWPREKYDLMPLKPVLNKRGQLVRTSKDPWPQMTFEVNITDKRTLADRSIVENLAANLDSYSIEEQKRAFFILGEIGSPPAIKVLNQSAESYVESKPPKFLRLAIERALRKIGPYWKPEADYPYWRSKGEN